MSFLIPAAYADAAAPAAAAGPAGSGLSDAARVIDRLRKFPAKTGLPSWM